MTDKKSNATPSTSEIPSQASHEARLGSLGSLFEFLTRREKSLISSEEKTKDIATPERVAESLPNLPRFLPDPPPPYFDRVIVGHGLPVEYRESPNGEHYLDDGHYLFRPLNPDHPDNREPT